MTRRHSVKYGDITIEYEVKRSRRRKKTFAITVEGGVAQLAAPYRATIRDMDAIILKSASWILKRLTQPSPQMAPKRFESGERFPYLGRSMTLVVESAKVRAAHVRFDHWRLLVTVPDRLDGAKRVDAIRRVVVGWYKERAAERLSAGVDHWWPRLGRREKSQVLIRANRRQWGSCTGDGTLRFNWRLMMIGQDLIDYVIVHELAHLTHLNHSQRFWALVSKVLPDAMERRKRLDDLSSALPWF